MNWQVNIIQREVSRILINLIFLLFLEIYRFLTSDAKIYLAPYECTTIYFLKEVSCRKKKLLKQSEMKTMQLPLYDGLFAEQLLDWAEQEQEGIALTAMPDKREEILKWPR